MHPEISVYTTAVSDVAPGATSAKSYEIHSKSSGELLKNDPMGLRSDFIPLFGGTRN